MEKTQHRFYDCYQSDLQVFAEFYWLLVTLSVTKGLVLRRTRFFTFGSE